MNQTTLIPTTTWVNDESASSVAANGDLDDYCNLAILIFANIVNLLSVDLIEPAMAGSRIAPVANQLWGDLQAWRQHRPRDVLPLLTTQSTKRNPFPTIVFTQSSSSTRVEYRD